MSKYVALDQIPDPRQNIEQEMISEEDARAEAAGVGLLIAHARALKEELNQLPSEERALVTTFLTEQHVRGRRWPPMSSAEAGELVGHTATWVRVWKLTVRQRYPAATRRDSAASNPRVRTCAAGRFCSAACSRH